MEILKTVSSHEVVCIALEVHLWSARIQLRADDLQKYSANLTNLPDAALASLGSVKICDPEVIRRFDRLKRDAQAVLERAGLPLFGVRAVPTAKFDEVNSELLDIKKKFDDEALALLQTYDSVISMWRVKWESANPGYAHLLDRIPKAETVFGRLSFDFHAYRVEPPKGVLEDESGAAFTTKLTGLRGELYADAARESMMLLESTFEKNGSSRDYITPKTLGPFKRIASRFRDFEMVDSSAIAAAELIEATVDQAMAFAQADKSNRISDGPLMLVLSMATTFANPSAAASIAEKSRSQGSQAVFDHLMNIGSVQATVETNADVAQASEAKDDLAQFESSLAAMKQCVSAAAMPQVEQNLLDLRITAGVQEIDVSATTPIAPSASVPVQLTSNSGLHLLHFNF